MADDHDVKWYLQEERAPSLYGWVFQQMALGATYAAIVFFGVIAFILILRAISFLLPEDPYAALMPLTAIGVA